MNADRVVDLMKSDEQLLSGIPELDEQYRAMDGAYKRRRFWAKAVWLLLGVGVGLLVVQMIVDQNPIWLVPAQALVAIGLWGCVVSYLDARLSAAEHGIALLGEVMKVKLFR